MSTSNETSPVTHPPQPWLGRLTTRLAVLLLGSLSAAAQTTWIGPAGGAYATAGNWSAGLPSLTVPGIIPNGATVVWTAATQLNNDTVTMNGNATLTGTAAGNLFGNGGSWTMNDTAVMTTTAAIVVQQNNDFRTPGYTFNLNDNATVRCPQFNVGRQGTATFNMNGGTLHATNNLTIGTISASNNGISNRVNFAAGSITSGNFQVNPTGNVHPDSWFNFTPESTGVWRITQANFDFAAQINLGNIRIDNALVTVGDFIISGDGLTYTEIQLPSGGNLVWLGDGGANQWTTNAGVLNWTNAMAGVVTNFIDGEKVTFDDSSANTTVNLVGTVAPGKLTVTNSVNSYTFSGGTISGGTGLIKQGAGTLTLSSVNLAYTDATVIEAGAVVVNSASAQTLAGLTGAGALTKQGGGTLTISGANTFSGTATVSAGSLVISNNASGNASYVVNAGSLSLIETAPGTLSVGSLQLANGVTLALNDGAASSAVPLINAAVYTNAGTLTVNYTTGVIAPGATPLIKYNPANAVLGTYTVTLPGGYAGSIVTNVANSTIDLMITGTPTKTWVGGDSSSPGFSEFQWAVGTYVNWSGATVFADGEYVSFLDGTTQPSVAVSTVAPSLMAVSNSATAYAFTGGGITTPLLVKQGPGIVSLQNSGNAFASISLQQGTLSYDAAITEAASIAGAGSLAVGSSANLTLSGNNSGFTGPINVASGGTLTLGVNNALGATNGTTTIANGASLEINGKTALTEQVIASGVGAGDGAIKNSVGSATTALAVFRQVTLAGDASFGGSGRWDIRGADDSGTNNAKLNTTGGSYNLTKDGANTVALISTDISPNINNITVNAGLLTFEIYTSSLGNPAGTLTLNGAQVTFVHSIAGFTPSFTKNLVANGGILRKAGTGNVNFQGPVNLISDLELQGNAGTLTINGAVSGGGNVNKTQGGTVALLGANNYSGTTTVSQGTLRLSTTSSSGGAYTVYTNATLGIVRVAPNGKMDIATSLTLGNTGAGTNTLLFDLGTFGGGATPVLDVSGGTLTTNGAVYRMVVEANLNNLGTGTTALFRYAPGTFTDAVLGTLPAGVVGIITNNTAANQVEMIVTSVSRALNWVGNVNTDWNINTTANWLDATNATTYKEVGLLGDIVTFGNGASNYTVNLATTVTPGGQYVSVTASNVYTFSGAGSIAGPVGVRVTDTGAGLVLGGNNTYTGGTFFDNGVITVTSESNLGGSSGELRWAGGTLQANGSLTNTRTLAFQTTGGRNQINVATNETVQFGGSITNSSVDTAFWKSSPGTLVLTNAGNLRVMVDGGTAVLGASAAITNGGQFQNISSTNGVARLAVKDSATLINTSTSGLNIADGIGQTNALIAGELYVTNNAVLSLHSLNVGKYLNATGRVYQTGGLVTNNNTGAGNWRLAGETIGVDTNTFGGYYLSGGSLLLTRPVQVGRLGVGELVVSGPGVMQATDLNLGTESTGRGQLTVNNGGSVTLTGNLNVPLNGQSGAAVISNNAVVSAGALVIGTSNAVNGSVTVSSGGTLAVGQVSGQATGTRAITFDGATLRASASSATFMEGLTSATIGTGGLIVDTTNNNVRINQNMSGSGGLTKTGTGTLTLDSQDYTGSTVVSAGTLAGNTDIGGTILQGHLIVNASGTVSPGQSLGTIYTANGKNVTLGGTAVMEIAKVGFNFFSDKLQADGLITQGGTLTVTFDGTHATALTFGNTFQFFQSGGGLAGGFSAVNLPTTDPVNGNVLTWNTSNLASAGSISVASTTPAVIAPVATNITYTVSGGQLILNWPNGQGWLLQGQTNPLSVGLRTNWVYLGTNSPYTNVLVAPSVFYRLIYTNAP